MAKKHISIRLSDDFLEQLNKKVLETGRTRTAILEQAINQLNNNSRQGKQELEVIAKQNEQLQIMLSATQSLIVEKDHKYNDMIQSKDDLIAELRRNKKIGFFSRLFGGNSIF